MGSDGGSSPFALSDVRLGCTTTTSNGSDDSLCGLLNFIFCLVLLNYSFCFASKRNIIHYQDNTPFILENL